MIVVTQFLGPLDCRVHCSLFFLFFFVSSSLFGNTLLEYAKSLLKTHLVFLTILERTQHHDLRVTTSGVPLYRTVGTVYCVSKAPQWVQPLRLEVPNASWRPVTSKNLLDGWCFLFSETAAKHMVDKSCFSIVRKSIIIIQSDLNIHHNVSLVLVL